MTIYRSTITPYFSLAPSLIAFRLCLPSIVAIPACLPPSQAPVVAARPPKAVKTASIPLSFAMAVGSVVRSVISILGVLCGHARLTRAPPNHALFDKRRAAEGVGNGSLTAPRGSRVARSRILLFLVVWSIVGSELKPAIEDPPSGRAPARYHLTAAIVARLRVLRCYTHEPGAGCLRDLGSRGCRGYSKCLR